MDSFGSCKGWHYTCNPTNKYVMNNSAKFYNEKREY